MPSRCALPFLKQRIRSPVDQNVSFILMLTRSRENAWKKCRNVMLP